MRGVFVCAGVRSWSGVRCTGVSGSAILSSTTYPSARFRNLGNFRVVLPPHWVLQHLERRAPVSQLPYFHIVPLLPLHAVAASLAVKNENNDPNYDQTCYDAASDCTLGRSRTVVVGTGISSTGGSLQFAQAGQGAVVPTLYCRWWDSGTASQRCLSLRQDRWSISQKRRVWIDRLEEVADLVNTSLPYAPSFSNT